MTEQEYMLVTNLARLRVCASALQDCMPVKMDGIDDALLVEASQAVYQLTEQYYEKIHPENGPNIIET